MTTVLVPVDRLGRWLENFESRHGSAGLSVLDGRLRGVAPDGSSFVAVAPFGREGIVASTADHLAKLGIL